MIYRNEKTKNISFPLGGIGAGCIGLAGNGALVDFEIFNRPNKNSHNGYSHFALSVRDGDRVQAKVLQGDTCEPLIGRSGGLNGSDFGHGANEFSMAGFPHFKEAEMEGKFPVALLSLSEEGFPVLAKLRALSPFIPQDDFHSSLPVAFFEWELENITDRELDISLAFTICNPAPSAFNEAISEGGISGVFLKNAGVTKEEIEYCELCAVTDHRDSVVEAFWYRGNWCDGQTMYWNAFSKGDRLPERTYDTPGKRDHAVLATYASLAPRGKKKIRFVLSWNVPNAYNYWRPYKDENGKDISWKNYYATKFESAVDSAKYALSRFDELSEKTERFADALQNSSLPAPAIDAISANLSVLRSPTVLRYEDGTLWGWEGCNERSGSCEGSCQHVWNYAYALPFLFPSLERTLRENTMRYGLMKNGATHFRIPLPLGREAKLFRACLDGQMGEVIKCYREWKISGDDDWMRAHAADVFRMLEYAWSEENPDRWDADKDGVLEGRQHHTLDVELFGPSSWMQGFYLLALDCAAQIADFVGEEKKAEEYREIYEKGREWTNENLFNGEYFYHRVDLADRAMLDRFGAAEYWNAETRQIKYQVGEGCIIDQMLSDFHALLIGRPGVFDPEKKKTALTSLYRNNFKESMREIANMWRNFAVDDEAGMLICTYPEGAKKPAIPISYCEECMTGFEYAAAVLMIANGFVTEGETMVKAIRDRYDGEKRNPWNEIECGSNYARSMASFALLSVYSGFSFDMTTKHIGFSPISKKGGNYLFSIAETWGNACITPEKHTLSVYGKGLPLASYGLPLGKTVLVVKADGKPIPFRTERYRVAFDPVVIEKTLEIEIV